MPFQDNQNQVLTKGSSTNEMRGLEMVDSERIDPCVWRYTIVLRPNGPPQVSLGQRPKFPR